MAVGIGYQGNVVSWAATTGTNVISNAALLALSLYNEFDLDIQSGNFDITAFRAFGTTSPGPGVEENKNGLLSWAGTLRGMNAARTPGHIGLVAVTSGYAANCYSWSLALRCREVDTTPFQPTGDFATSAAGLIGWSGEYAAWIDDTTALVLPNLHGATVTPTFTISSSNTMTGSANITGMRTVVRLEGQQLVNFTYKGTGNLTSSGSAGLIPAGTVLTPFKSSEMVLAYNDGSGTDKTATGTCYPISAMIRVVVGQRTETEIGFRGTGPVAFA